jgi:type II secretory pathway predicted ATPase ExeA
MNVNPFLSIVPRKGEKMFGISEKNIMLMADGVSKGKKLLLISGDYGSGKSLIADKIEKNLTSDIKLEKWMFTVDLANQLRSLPMEETVRRKVVVFIDKFELSDVIDDKALAKVLELIVEITQMGVSFIIDVNPKTVMRLYDLNAAFKNLSELYTVKPMIFQEVKELVLSRLNEVRTTHSHDLSPFTEKDLMDIWKKSHGNPRMIILILANLYDIKMAERR